MKELYNCDSLIAFIDKIDAEEGWWYSMPNPGNKTLDEFDHAIPPISKTVGIKNDTIKHAG